MENKIINYYYYYHYYYYYIRPLLLSLMLVVIQYPRHKNLNFVIHAQYNF